MSSSTQTRESSGLGSWGTVGVAAPLLFTASAIVHSLARADHSLLADPVSALAAGADGWIQDVTFMVTGVLLLGFAWGMHLSLASADRFDLPGLLLAVFGLGVVGAGVFPAIDAGGEFTADRTAHVVAGMITFASAGLASLALAPRLNETPRWNSLTVYVRGVGIGLVVLFVAGGVLVRPSGAPLQNYIGLFQWIFLAIWFPCVIVLALRLLRNGRTR